MSRPKGSKNKRKKMGRPVGSKNKVKLNRPVKEVVKKMGRPAGSKNKVNPTIQFADVKAMPVKAKMGRPVGSKNKVELNRPVKKVMGRPAGSKNKVKAKMGRPVGSKNNKVKLGRPAKIEVKKDPIIRILELLQEGLSHLRSISEKA